MIFTRLISNVNGSDDEVNSKKGETKLFFESKVKEDIFAEADNERLTQVIYNLLDNAFTFTKGHGESIQITLEKQEQQGVHHANISIIETGTGIDPEILPRLFSKFVTKSQKGTGIGLYISRNIVEAYGGRLYANNNLNDRGATFTITIPLFRE